MIARQLLVRDAAARSFSMARTIERARIYTTNKNRFALSFFEHRVSLRFVVYSILFQSFFKFTTVVILLQSVFYYYFRVFTKCAPI
jgi:hypothetical protein